MPKDRDFIDSDGLVGRDRFRPQANKELTVKLSRSIDDKLDSYNHKIRFEAKVRYMSIDFSRVVGTKVFVNKTNMKELALWILTTLERKDVTAKRQEAHMAGESREDS